MGKILVWIVVVFVVLFALRLVNVAAARRRRGDAPGKGGNAGPVRVTMVRCARCGVFLPQADAKRAAEGFVCGDANCASRR